MAGSGDALERIDEKTKARRVDRRRSEQCRVWSRYGYIIVKKLIDDPTLDIVWSGLERRFRSGRIRLEREPAGGQDPYPGAFLNPHRKSGSLCRI